MEEEFKPMLFCPQLENFEISKTGLIRNKKTGKIRKTQLEKGKYKSVNITGKDKIQTKYFINLLVRLTWNIDLDNENL